jgi:hypothetical protein
MPAAYVAASFRHYEQAQAMQRALALLDLRITSSWADQAETSMGLEDLESMSVADRTRVYMANDAALERADIVVVLASEGARETFAEARLAIHWGKLVVWVGSPKPLSAWRFGVVRCETAELALAFLEGYLGPKRRAI